VPGDYPGNRIGSGSTSTQASDVVCHGLDFAIVKLGSNLRHLNAIAALAVTEGRELGGGVVGVLAGQTRVLGRDAGAVGAVAACAGGDVALLDATTVDALAHGHQVLVLGKAVLGLLRMQPGGDVLHVRLAEHAGKALHHRVLALVVLELQQLLDQVLGMLAGQLGLDGHRRIAVGRMACRADGGVAGLALRQIGLGRLRLSRGSRCLASGESGKGGGCSKNGSRQQRGKQLHIEGVVLLLKAQNSADSTMGPPVIDI
ncbi:hypothetical protein COLO4_00868, partial [Corchorus olitorius]